MIKNVGDIDSFEEGNVLVTHRTDPDWEPVYEQSLSLIEFMCICSPVHRMKKSTAIVTDQGGRTCHAAMYNVLRVRPPVQIVMTSVGSIARELGIPAIVGTNDGCAVIKDGQEVTISGAEGEEGKVYDGIVEVSVRQTEVDKGPLFSSLVNRMSHLTNLSVPTSSLQCVPR